VPVTRGFRRRDPGAAQAALPPGQYDTGTGWPVLTAEPAPRVDLATWGLTVDGAVAHQRRWNWEELHELPESSYSGDIHCVTTWSKRGVTFTGVSVDVLLASAQPSAEATHVMAHSTTGYTTNLPLADVSDGRAWVVWDFDGAPLTQAHGGPVRLLVPHLYFWKSAKWIARLELMTHNRPGFWETYGYHDRGDPWREQRYQGDA
jgi:DMSO/TMAO reductase YedYZ molybdopterin-dependent catalytic subunit